MHCISNYIKSYMIVVTFCFIFLWPVFTEFYKTSIEFYIIT